MQILRQHKQKYVNTDRYYVQSCKSSKKGTESQHCPQSAIIPKGQMQYAVAQQVHGFFFSIVVL